MVLLTAFLVAGMALAHLFSYKLLFLQGIPRSPWLSIAGGISVAYVFLHILPELSESQGHIEETGGLVVGYLEHHVYLVALLGLGIFYGLERAAKEKRERSTAEDKGPAYVFWLHMVSFSIYNALIGYLLLHRVDQSIQSLLLFFFAMAVHFVVNDYGLREDHEENYDRRGRWILAAALFVGWAVGLATEIHEAAIAVLFAFLAGSVVLNVLKEELPRERKSRFWAFALGALAYAVLLLVM